MIKGLVRSITAPYYRYSPLVTSHDLLKAAAIFFMIIDHIGAYYYPEEMIYRVFGRTTLPAWFFLVGYNYKKPTKIFDLLLISSLLLQVTLYLLGKKLFPINALFSIYLCRWALPYIKVRNDFEWVITCVLALTLYLYTNFCFEYGTIGMLMSYYGYKIRENKSIVYSFMTCITVCTSQILTFDFTVIERILSIILISVCFVILHSYKISTIKMRNVYVIPIKIFGRYSLFIYCFHLILIFLSKKIL